MSVKLEKRKTPRHIPDTYQVQNYGVQRSFEVNFRGPDMKTGTTNTNLRE